MQIDLNRQDIEANRIVPIVTDNDSGSDNEIVANSTGFRLLSH